MVYYQCIQHPDHSADKDRLLHCFNLLHPRACRDTGPAAAVERGDVARPLGGPEMNVFDSVVKIV